MLPFLCTPRWLTVPALLCGLPLVTQASPLELHTSYSRLLPATSHPDQQVSGRVVDAKDAPIPGVTVVVKGTSIGASTNADGTFLLAVPSTVTAPALHISYIGYIAQDVVVGDRNDIKVTLLEDTEKLGEVVVVGYGTQKRSTITGAVASVPMKEIVDLPVVNIGQALQGRVTGVTVVNNGSPGAAPIVRIRGVASINAGSGPLYVVDGYPTGDINSVDSNNIESIEVLKDASAAAIYGSRAAAGVILITTKKGKAGKMRVNYETYFGTQQPWRKLDLLNREQYIQYGSRLLPPTSLPGRFGTLNEPLYTGTDRTYNQTDTDWQSEVLRSAHTQSHDLSLSGGSETSRFYAAASYLKQDGVLVGTGYDRKNAILNSEHRISEVFTVGQTLQGSYDYRLGEVGATGRTLLMHAIRFAPYLPVEDPTRLGGYRGPDNVDSSDPENPVRLGLQEKREARRLKLLSTAYLEARLTDWLRARGTAGVDYSNLEDIQFAPIYQTGTYHSRLQAVYFERPSTAIGTLFSGQLTADKTLGQHNINVVAVAERQFSSNRSGTSSGTKNTNDFASGADLLLPQFTSSRSENVLIGLVGRVNYSYADKYLLSVSVRRDGSSQYPQGKWGTFPAASVGWNLNQENFMKNLAFLSELRLRASYGRVGKNISGAYPTDPVLTSNNYYVFGTGNVQAPNFTVNTLDNRNLRWENTDMTNVGLDVGLLDNKVTFVAEYFIRDAKNLITNPPLPPSLGYDNSGPFNLGQMKNTGVEFALGYREQTKPLQWNVSANLSAIRNRVEQLRIPGATIASGTWSEGGNVTRTEAGRPVGEFYGYQVEKIFQSKEEVDAANAAALAAANAALAPGQPAITSLFYQVGATAAGDIKFRDLNGDGRVNGQDQTHLGSWLPKFTYGLNAGANFKGLDVSIFFQGSQGNKIYSAIGHELIGMKRLFNASTEVLNAWTPENPSTDMPRAISGDPNNNTRISDRFIQDGSYLRLKTATLGYSVPETALKAVLHGTVTRFRVYVSAYNLLTFTGYTLGYDPEIGSRTDSDLASGVDYANYPQNRNLQVGLQVGF